jgi:hypothetical protein
MSDRDESPNEDPRPSSGAEAIENFLAQPPLVETPGLDDAALEREETLHQGPDAESIAEAIELLHQRHSFE